MSKHDLKVLKNELDECLELLDEDRIKESIRNLIHVVRKILEDIDNQG